MAKVAGVDVLLKVKTGVSEYTALGGQKSASLKRSANTIDTTDKNSNGWAESMAGVKTWSIDCDAFVVLGDTALETLFTAFDARTAIDVTIRVGADSDAGGYTYSGSAVIVDFPEDYPQDDAVSISLSLQGASPLVRTKGVITP
ncbi:phage tail protein [Clostridium sporogenes]|uniref:phage tail tube protein n=1 Tax=Clostridium sporogenes TaxID=1509 RepID=UPI002238377A|nr:phage tail protein [Clostridium sporogenes]MCW6094548.1 phage tail protein [Clostridium sporogenes]